MAAAIGATGIFVAAAAVGANQTRQQVSALAPPDAASVSTPARPRPRRTPTVVFVATPVPPAAVAPTQPGVVQSQPAATSAPTSPANPAPSDAAPALPVPTRARPNPTAIPPAPADAPPDVDVSPDQADSPPDAAQPVPGAQAPAPGTANPPATKPNQPRRTPTPNTAPAPTPERVVPERSRAGTIKDVLPDGLDVIGVGGREWHVVPAAGALIRLNGKAARLDALHVGDTVVVLGQAQGKEGPLFRFLSHAITARGK